MREPEIDKTYIYVRVHGTAIEHSEFIRSDDGGALIVRDGVAHIFEHNANGWRSALQYLKNSDFVEVGLAKASGAVPQDWSPPPVVPGPVVVSK